MVIVDDEVDRADEIEGDTNSQNSGRILTVSSASMASIAGREVAVSGEGGEIRRQVGADHAGKHEDEPEEAEAVQRGDGAMRFDPVHRL